MKPTTPIESTAAKVRESAEVVPGPAPRPDTLCTPDCPICGGAGWIRWDVPVGHPKFGRVDPCPQVPAGSKLHNNHGLTFEERRTLSWAGIRKRENVFQAIDGVQKAIRRGRGLVYLYGGPGLAKTLVLKTACAEWARAGKGVFFFTTLADILEDLRTAYDDDQPNRALKEKEEKYASFPLLCIDEVGAQRDTSFSLEKFFSLINKRHEAGTERGAPLLTLMASNVSPEKIDFRITDRLTDGRNVIIQLTGKSFRPALDWENSDE